MEEWMTQIESIQVEQRSQLSRILAAKAKTSPNLLDVLRNQDTKKENTLFVVGQKIDAAEGVEGLEIEDGELSIPSKHNTAAHKLLVWPSIKSLLYPQMYDVDYVMKLEESRGQIQVYGRGEGDEGYPPAGLASGGTWRDLTPPTSVKTVEHGIKESGIFATNSDAVHRLYLSYMDHMHKLHPFLDQEDLKKKIQTFVCTYCASMKPSAAAEITCREPSAGARRRQLVELIARFRRLSCLLAMRLLYWSLPWAVSVNVVIVLCLARSPTDPRIIAKSRFSAKRFPVVRAVQIRST